MPFNYKRMQKVANRLLGPKVFGNPFILKKVKNKTKYDPTTKKQVKVYTEHEGVGVLLPYAEETIGALDNIVKAGDKRFVCQMKEEEVIPVESKDQVFFQGELYNILSVKTLNPNGQKLLTHTLQLRKAAEGLS